jgi:hypothetical protein
MKVNVLGKGLIPGLKAIAPVKNVEATQEQVAKIIKIRTLKVFVADDTLTQITPDNIDAIFNPGVALAEEALKEEAAKKEEAKKPKKAKKESKAEEVIEKAIENDIPVEVETPDETPVEEPVKEEPVGIREYTGELSEYSSSWDPKFVNEEAPAEETTGDDPAEEPAEEVATEEAPKSYSKKNKKNKNK